jgi:hypothetical protein
MESAVVADPRSRVLMVMCQMLIKHMSRLLWYQWVTCLYPLYYECHGIIANGWLWISWRSRVNIIHMSRFVLGDVLRMICSCNMEQYNTMKHYIRVTHPELRYMLWLHGSRFSEYQAITCLIWHSQSFVTNYSDNSFVLRLLVLMDLFAACYAIYISLS